MVRVFLFSSLRIGSNLQEEFELDTTRDSVRSLFTLLCIASQQALTQDTVCDALWPGLGYASAVNRMHQTIYALRHCLANATGEQDWITVKRGTIAISKKFSADVLDLLDVVKTDMAPRTLVELLQIQVLTDGAFAPWLPSSTYANEIGEKVRQARITLCRKIVDAMIANGDLEQSRSQVDRLIVLSPYEEDLYKLAIALDIRLGLYQNALDLFDKCSRQLVQGLGIRPSAELIELGKTAEQLMRLWEHVSNKPYSAKWYSTSV